MKLGTTERERGEGREREREKKQTKRERRQKEKNSNHVGVAPYYPASMLHTLKAVSCKKLYKANRLWSTATRAKAWSGHPILPPLWLWQE